jgi:drug/metabolite transporter (DMT)-like permease
VTSGLWGPHRAAGSATRIAILTVLAMLAFAGNSLLCRAALQGNAIDPASFSVIRLISGAALLGTIHRARRGGALAGSWLSALALFAYVVGFSFAYVRLTVATGALLLFGAVQVTMIGKAVARGMRMSWIQWLGSALAVGGLVVLTLPGLVTPSPGAAALMLAAGVAWGVYSLRVNRAQDPVSETAGNFLRTVPIVVVMAVVLSRSMHVTTIGASYAIASGAVASGLGYALWYAVVPELGPIRAAVVQLAVPAIAALGGVLLLSESFTLRVTMASLAILGGVALGLRRQRAK